MFKPYAYDPSAWMKFGLALQEMTLTSAEAIYHRNVLMWNGKLSPLEFSRMVMEKPVAFSQGFEAAALAAARGASYAKVASAAIKPLSARSGANARRLRP